jgi:hypothetical protein
LANTSLLPKKTVLWIRIRSDPEMFGQVGP